MKTDDLIIAVNTVWLQNGGTHGSPVGPLLYAPQRPAAAWAALGQSPAPPAIAASSSTEGSIQ
jgi:hypothetical protein